MVSPSSYYSPEHHFFMLTLVAEGHPRLAEALATAALARQGESSSLLLAQGLARVAAGELDRARDPLEKFLDLGDRNDARYAPMVQALLARDWGGYRAALETFVKRRFYCPRLLWRIAELPAP
jgi:tetratricopeptide (TPR) repeat protein